MDMNTNRKSRPPYDFSLLIRDSLKSFNLLKCSIDDIGSDVRPFYEKNVRNNDNGDINSQEQLYCSVLKNHTNIVQDPNLPQLDTFKHQNERYLDELIDYLMKTKNTKINTRKTNNQMMKILPAEKDGFGLTDLVESIIGYPMMPLNNDETSLNIGSNHQSIRTNNQLLNATNMSNLNPKVIMKDSEWEKFKSDFVFKNSEYYFQMNSVVSKTSHEQTFTNNMISSSRIRKCDNSRLYPYPKDTTNKLSTSSTVSNVSAPARCIKLDPVVVSNPHCIVFKKENLLCNNASLNISMLEFVFIEQIILYNNLSKSDKTNLFIVDSNQRIISPQAIFLNSKLPSDIEEIDSDNQTIPYATFVAIHFSNGYVANESMFVENWMLLGSQLALMKGIVKENAVHFRQSSQFTNIIIETSWNHLCLKEKRRLMKSIRQQYSIDNTVDIIYCYYCNKDKFYTSESSSIKESVLWKCIYSCIRCGDIRAASVFAEGLNLENVVFSQYVSAFANNDLENLKELREALLELYTFEDDSKLTIKRLVFSLLLNLEDVDLSIYFQNLDDLMWYKFSKAHFFKQIPLGNIRADINDIFCNNMTDGSLSSVVDPLTFAQALLYCGDYVGCISYLSDFSALSSHMVNLAIAMYTEDVISLNDYSINETIVDTNENADTLCVDLKDMFSMYIKKLSDIKVDLAVECIYMMKDIDNGLVMLFITQISLVTSNISRLFGNILPDGSHTDCLLNLFERDSDKILNHVAKVLEKNNDMYHAIRIYDISKNYKKVVKLINKMLCETICLSATDKKRNKIFETSNFIYNRMIEHNWNVDISQRLLFEFLHDYLWFENLMEANDLASTLQVAEDCRFIPTNSDSLYDFQELIKNLPPIAFRFFGTFLRSVATLFYNQYVATTDPLNVFCFNNQDASIIKNKMKCLVKMVTQMCMDSFIPSDAMQAILLIDNKIMV